MPDFVIREWTLQPYDGDQAPLHLPGGVAQAYFSEASGHGTVFWSCLHRLLRRRP